MSRLLFFAAIAFFVSVGVAHAQFIGFKQDRVTIPIIGLSDNSFEVVRSAFTSPANIWCAAGTYAENVLGQTSGRLWVTRPLTDTPSGKAMVFSTIAVTPEKKTFSYSLNTAGVTKSLAGALAACRADTEHVIVETAHGRIIAR